MTKLQIIMLTTVLHNFDCLPKTIEVNNERVETGYLLYLAKSGHLHSLYKLNSEVISRRGKLLRN